ncbi:MAG: hypothetical protein ACK5MA_11355 [Parachlamydiaceae bacterium]
MQRNLYALLAISAGLSSCGGINDTFRALEENRQAIDNSTCVIEENIRAIEEANRGIEENRRQLEAINEELKKASQN